MMIRLKMMRRWYDGAPAAPTWITSTDKSITIGARSSSPHRFYDWMRREVPVYRAEMAYLPGQDVYLLSGYDGDVPFRHVRENTSPAAR